MKQLTSQICNELFSQTIIDLTKYESASNLSSDRELQKSQEYGYKNGVEREVEKEEMRYQPQIILVNKSSEQFSNVVTPPPFFSPTCS
mgnify:CR=1 FL=1